MSTFDMENPNHKQEKKSVIRLNAVGYFCKNLNDASREQEERMTHNIEISSSSRRSKQGRKM